jgi:hypothetical protein
LFRSNELSEAEVRFLQLKDKIPILVGISREVGIISHEYILQDGSVSDQNFISNSYSLESHGHNIDSVNPFALEFGCDVNYVGCPGSKDTNTIKFISKYLLTKLSEKLL